jgi:sterol desaturase/sphingolipid hydroxylase (fatty acid hydroxylase superfamily)
MPFAAAAAPSDPEVRLTMWDRFQGFIAEVDPLTWWLAGFLLSGLLAGILTGYFRARKIQPNGFRWRIFRNEMLFAIVNLAVSAVLLGGLSKFLQHHGIIRFNTAAASPWIVAAEFALYFFAFDAYFYWLHRLMHIEPIYSWVHKIHHHSISPNPLTTLSVSPLESFINGGFVPLFTALLTVHASTMALIAPTNIIMGLYVHSGIEFLPNWWNRSWITKWFITATFHDQHHRYFKGNYGGYTTLWDRICTTVRPTFPADFQKITTRPITLNTQTQNTHPANTG